MRKNKDMREYCILIRQARGMGTHETDKYDCVLQNNGTFSKKHWSARQFKNAESAKLGLIELKKERSENGLHGSFFIRTIFVV